MRSLERKQKYTTHTAEFIAMGKFIAETRKSKLIGPIARIARHSEYFARLPLVFLSTAIETITGTPSFPDRNGFLNEADREHYDYGRNYPKTHPLEYFISLFIGVPIMTLAISKSAFVIPYLVFGTARNAWIRSHG